MNETENKEAQELDLIDMTVQTMAGDLLKVVIDELKAAPEVWAKLSQFTQDDIIDRAKKRVRASVETAVHLIASEGRQVIAADVEQVVFKDGVKAVLKVRSGDPNRHALADSVNDAVLIVVGGAGTFMGGTDDVQSDPDQQPLAFNEDSDLPDPLYSSAVDLIRKAESASISLIQRQLKIGYNRAARLIERMEAEGVVSPMAKDGSREVLRAQVLSLVPGEAGEAAETDAAAAEDQAAETVTTDDDQS